MYLRLYYSKAAPKLSFYLAIRFFNFVYAAAGKTVLYGHVVFF